MERVQGTQETYQGAERVTKQQHPIAPTPELVEQWVSLACEYEGNETWIDLATQAARWGADQELEACCEWLQDPDLNVDTDKLRAARRPKPPSLKERALDAQMRMWNGGVTRDDWELVRHALEQLDD